MSSFQEDNAEYNFSVKAERKEGSMSQEGESLMFSFLFLFIWLFCCLFFVSQNSTREIAAERRN